MSFISLFLTAFGLSMDAFAVAVTNGICLKRFQIRYAVKVGLYFGIFQALMPVIGWLAGINFNSYITNLDHWIAFILLGFIGGRMLYEGFKKEGENCKTHGIPGNKTLLIMAVATSIDALAVGVSFAFLRISIVGAAVTIGFVAFFASAIGVGVGNKFGMLFRKKAEIIGGIILIGIGTRILIQHLYR